MVATTRTEREKFALVAHYTARDPRRPGLSDSWLKD